MARLEELKRVEEGRARKAAEDAERLKKESERLEAERAEEILRAQLAKEKEEKEVTFFAKYARTGREILTLLTFRRRRCKPSLMLKRLSVAQKKAGRLPSLARFAFMNIFWIVQKINVATECPKVCCPRDFPEIDGWSHCRSKTSRY